MDQKQQPTELVQTPCQNPILDKRAGVLGQVPGCIAQFRRSNLTGWACEPVRPGCAYPGARSLLSEVRLDSAKGPAAGSAHRVCLHRRRSLNDSSALPLVFVICKRA
jgi:hypothetical protein